MSFTSHCIDSPQSAQKSLHQAEADISVPSPTLHQQFKAVYKGL